MADQCCRVADDLEAVVQTAVMLAVDALLVLIADGEDFLGIAADLACTVNFKLHTEVPGRIPVENGFGAVTVIVNGVVSEHLTAAFAIGHIILVVQIKNAVKGQHCPAAFAGRIVSVKASLAKRMLRRSRVLLTPNPCAAVSADKSFLVQTGFAEQFIVHKNQFILWESCSAYSAHIIAVHAINPPFVVLDASFRHAGALRPLRYKT